MTMKIFRNQIEMTTTNTVMANDDGDVNAARVRPLGGYISYGVQPSCSNSRNTTSIPDMKRQRINMPVPRLIVYSVIFFPLAMRDF